MWMIDWAAERLIAVFWILLPFAVALTAAAVVCLLFMPAALLLSGRMFHAISALALRFSAWSADFAGAIDDGRKSYEDRRLLRAIGDVFA